MYHELRKRGTSRTEGTHAAAASASLLRAANIPCPELHHEFQPVPANTGKEPEEHPCGERSSQSVEMAEHNVNAEPQADGKRQQRDSGKAACRAMDADGVFPVFDDPVLQRRRDEKPDGNGHQQLTGTVEQASGRRKTGKRLLEYAIELESEQDLCTQDQQPDFIERCFYFLAEIDVLATCHHAALRAPFFAGGGAPSCSLDISHFPVSIEVIAAAARCANGCSRALTKRRLGHAVPAR
jgi:hypothetical protein